MSVIKYIGRKTNFKGKTLWEICGNLKDGGVGRIVVRSMFERYPEPSFMKILKVEADDFAKPRKVKVLVEKTFRGVKLPKPVLIYSTSYKADYRLLHKDQEEEYCNITKVKEEKIIPNQSEFPPLMKEMILKDYVKRGEQPPNDLYMILNLQKAINSRYKPASEKESRILTMGLGDPLSPHLYEPVFKKM